MAEISREKPREQREAEALWIIGGKGFFDHGAIDDGAIRAVIHILAPTHSKEETFAVFQKGLGADNLRTSIAFGWDDIADVVEEMYNAAFSTVTP